jgi:hypothetical protein
MGITDFFKKKKDEEKTEEKGVSDKKAIDFSAAMSGIDTSQLSMKEKIGLKMFQKMSPKKQEELLRQAMNPGEIAKHKDKILKQINEMVKNGQIDKGQAAAVKSKMGLR